MDWLKEIKFDANGLIPVITQDYQNKEVLMLAYMNEVALNKTIETGKVHYYSRSRAEQWLKGETSGHYQIVKAITYDCDGDTLLIQVDQIGAACHTGHRSCFYRDTQKGEMGEASKVEYFDSRMLKDEYDTIVDRKNDPKEGSYTNYLLDKGIDKTLKKVGEEAAEVIIAAKNSDKDETVGEIADLLYHLQVAMVQSDIKWEDIFEEIKNRRE
jgi:phosphoribosyl-ATP pyrophosphohydrolase/phosphoribosyl-AMP cyclohydrolase